MPTAFIRLPSSLRQIMLVINCHFEWIGFFCFCFCYYSFYSFPNLVSYIFDVQYCNAEKLYEVVCHHGS